ncbi:hypothetical protein MW887_005996 [Aspergillus wentii]|nr:hypothetical protein MW887_005996 [Aspergillus wentii]
MVSSSFQASNPMERANSTSSELSFSFSDSFPPYDYGVEELPCSQPALDQFPYFPPSSPYAMQDFSPPSPYTLSEFSPPSNTSFPFPVASSYSSFYEPLLPWTPSCDEVQMPRFAPVAGDSPPEQSRPVKPFACEECGRAFTRSADLRRHQSSVHYPVYQDCPMPDCPRKNGRGFPRRDHLNEHLRSSHHVHVPKRRRLTKTA